MPRTVIIRIVVDNKDAINAAKAQAIAQKSLNDTIAAGNSEIRKAEEHTRKMGIAQEGAAKAVEGTNNSFTKWFIQLRLISSAYNAFSSAIVSSISSYANLELSIAKIGAVTGDSKEQLVGLQQTIYALGRTTAVSTNDIGNAALELSKLGFEGKALEVALTGVTKLASILGDSLETTGNLVGGVIQTFDLSAEEAAKVADKLFVATGKSATNIEGFRIAFALAGNVAHDAGISFDDLAAAIAALSNQGIRASTIGTGFRNFIGELSKEGSKAQKALGGSIEELGLVGAMKKLSELKLSPGSLIEIFGKPGSPVASGLSHASEEFNKLHKDIKDANGTLEHTGGIINDTLIGSIQLLTNNFKELFATAASPSADALKSLLNDYVDLLQRANEHNAKRSYVTGFEENLRAKGVDYHQALGLKKDDLFDFQDLDEKYRRVKLYQDLLQHTQDQEKQAGPDLHKFSADDKFVAPVKKAEDNSKALLNNIAAIRLEFTKYKNGDADTFKFGESEKELEKIRDHFEKLNPKKAKQAEDLLQSLRSYDQEQLDKDSLKARQSYKKDKAAQRESGPQAVNPDSLGEMDQYLVNMQEELDNFNQALEQTKLAFNEIDGALKTMSSQMVDSLFSWEWSWTHFGYVVKDIFKQLVKDFIAMEIRIIALKAAIKVGGYLASVYTGGGSVVAADAAGGYVQGAAEANFNSQYNTAVGAGFLASGYDGYVSGATKFIAGEAGMERVTVTPMNKPGFYHNESSGGGMTIIVQGDVFNAERLVDKVNKSNELSRARYV